MPEAFSSKPRATRILSWRTGSTSILFNDITLHSGKDKTWLGLGKDDRCSVKFRHKDKMVKFKNTREVWLKLGAKSTWIGPENDSWYQTKCGLQPPRWRSCVCVCVTLHSNVPLGRFAFGKNVAPRHLLSSEIDVDGFALQVKQKAHASILITKKRHFLHLCVPTHTHAFTQRSSFVTQVYSVNSRECPCVIASWRGCVCVCVMRERKRERENIPCPAAYDGNINLSLSGWLLCLLMSSFILTWCCFVCCVVNVCWWCGDNSLLSNELVWFFVWSRCVCVVMCGDRSRRGVCVWWEHYRDQGQRVCSPSRPQVAGYAIFPR